ncbi:MAG: cold shock domain-containing protein [Candidatus Krumholzibacteriota bacterium]|nr:cold shock domain-containing protein [Candidatus Krumholzibacteriota bacterium]
MPKGIIKFFSETRGYGFIEAQEEDPARDASNDLFVHHSQIAEKGYRTLREGDEVTFDVRDGQRGLEAVNVHRVS